jgi:AraC-like DNA-binding protein
MHAGVSANSPLRVTRITVQTRDLELAHDLLSEQYAAHRPQCTGSRERFRFSLSSTTIGSISADLLTHSVSTVVTTEPVHHLTVAHQGRGAVLIQRGREEVHLGPGDVALYPCATDFSVRWNMMDQSIVRLSFDKIAEFAAATTGSDAPVRFLGVRPVSADMARYWRTVTTFVHRELTAPGSAITEPLVLARIEDTLSAAALSVFPNTALTPQTRASSVGQVGPGTVRRAVAYIDSHAEQAITLADIAAEAGVSGRVLQRSFAAQYDTTPTGYLRRVRLERAHQELRAGDPTRDNVAQIARRWGFATPSRFADAYRHVYGADPDHTLRT